MFKVVPANINKLFAIYIHTYYVSIIENNMQMMQGEKQDKTKKSIIFISFRILIYNKFLKTQYSIQVFVNQYFIL